MSVANNPYSVSGVAQQNPYRLWGAPSEPDPVIWMTFFGLLLVALCIVYVGVRYLIRKRPSAADGRASFISIVLLGLLSFTIGLLGFLAEIWRTLIKVSAAGTAYWEALAWPLSEALRLFCWGLAGAAFAMAFLLAFALLKSPVELENGR